jgi:hypothetical protein
MTHDGAVIEWAPFTLADGVAEATLLDASEALQRDFLAAQPGFVRRELLRAADGGWVDLVVWADAESAERVMEGAGASAACAAYFALMRGADPANPGAGVAHLRRVRAY